MQQTRGNEQFVDYTTINYRTFKCSHEIVRIKMNLIDFNDQLTWKSDNVRGWAIIFTF
jgi:hypothetical protein